MASNTIQVYNATWEGDIDAVQLEMACIQMGGRWVKPDGKLAGKGLYHHYRQLQSLLWPDDKWHRWRELTLQNFLGHRVVSIIGPASSAKTHDAALFGLCFYYCFPHETTILCTSTDLERLEMRIWGEIKKYHREARRQFNYLPGYLIESRRRIVTETRDEETDGRDFRNGICGVPCKKGEHFVGMGSFVGIKNKHVILIADEGQFMPRAYVDSISNLNKNPDFKCIVMGNPMSTTDALGIISEPSSENHGWSGGVDQEGGTKTWDTRFPNGICIQLVGTDSPNFDVPETEPIPFPFLITRKAIADDIAFYTKDSLQFSMMNEGRMPKGEGSRRVITRQMCEQFRAKEGVTWEGGDVIRLAGLDASYASIGGDRTVFCELQFGRDVTGVTRIAMTNLTVVPVSAKLSELPEDQIARWVKDRCDERGIIPENFFFDSTGRGSLMAAFARNWSAYVVPVEFGGKPSRRIVSRGLYIDDRGERRLKTCREHYSKFVSELWFSVRYAIEAGQFRGLTDEVIMEGSSREWVMTNNGLVEVEPKDKTKQRMGRSPDLFDALAAGMEGARQRGFVIGAGDEAAPRQKADDALQWLAQRMTRLRQAHELHRN